MSATVTATPLGGTHAKDVFTFAVAGATGNDATANDTAKYPTEPELHYYLSFIVSAKEQGRSQVFGVTPDGAFQFNSYIFPSAGSWTVALCKTSDDSQVATTSVTVA